jgi:hypothetical protein
MAANYKAELKDVDSVMAFYNLHKTNQLFVIYAGVTMANIPLYYYTDKEAPEMAEDILRGCLDLINRDATNTNVYTIILVDDIIEQKGKEPKYTGKAMRFQLHQPQPYNSNNGKEIIFNNIPTLPTSGENEVVFLLKNLLQEQKEENEKLRNLIEERLSNDNNEEEEEEEEEEQIPIPKTTGERIAGIAANMMERDEVQEAIAGLIINGQRWLTKKVFKIEENG